MVVQDGRVIASWGHLSRKVNVASVRKSLLSALYGVVVAEAGSISTALLPSSVSTISKAASIIDKSEGGHLRRSIYHPRSGSWT